MTEQQTSKQIQALEKVQPLWKIVLTQFFEHRMAVVGAFTILTFCLIALFAPVISKVTGIDPNSQNPTMRYQPVWTRATLPNTQREEKVIQFESEFPALASELTEALNNQNLVAVEAPEDAIYNLVNLERSEIDQILAKIPGPAAQKYTSMVDNFTTLHILGTDELGRDVFMRLVYGTRVSMGVGILVALTSTILGLLIGALAGYYGGWVDVVLMRATDALLALPILPVLIVLAAVDLNKVPIFREIFGSQNENIAKLVFILVLFSWMSTARLVRGSILSLREREFILAARTLGATDSTIILRHMVPNVVAPLLVSVTLGVGGSILFEAALSFLGLGVQQPTPSWGNMLFNAQDLISQAPFLAILPGLLILVTTMSFNFLGDGLQDAVDPKAIRR